MPATTEQTVLLNIPLDLYSMFQKLRANPYLPLLLTLKRMNEYEKKYGQKITTITLQAN